MDVNSTEMKNKIVQAQHDLEQAGIRLEKVQKDYNEVTQRLKALIGHTSSDAKEILRAANEKIGAIHRQELKNGY